MKPQTLKQRVQEVAAIVSAARNLVTAGHVVDLSTLERNTADLCQSVGDMSPDEGREIRPMLVSLIDDLDKLAGDLKARQAELKGELDNLSTRERATAAYGQGPAKSR